MLPASRICVYRVYICTDRTIVIDVAPLGRLKHYADTPYVKRPAQSRFLTFEILGRMVTRAGEDGIIHRVKINRSIGLRREFIWNNESTDKMDVTSLYYPFVLLLSSLFLSSPSNLHFRKLCPISRALSWPRNDVVSRSDDIIATGFVIICRKSRPLRQTRPPFKITKHLTFKCTAKNSFEGQHIAQMKYIYYKWTTYVYGVLCQEWHFNTTTCNTEHAWNSPFCDWIKIPLCFPTN